MAFGGTVKRGCRTDTRRFRRINPLGPDPERQAKLLGESCFESWDDGYGQSRHALHERIAYKEMGNPDMTLIPRRLADRPVRLYLRGRTVLAFEVLDGE